MVLRMDFDDFDGDSNTADAKYPRCPFETGGKVDVLRNVTVCLQV
jgi:hypothetical protein